MSINKNGLRIRLKSYDVRLLDKVIEELIRVAKTSAKIVVQGPIPLPNERRIITVQKSPYIYKESNEQFELCCHKRVLIFFVNTSKDMEMLSNVVIPGGVQISIGR
ncbi:MAG: 30S ribosomal protein S10 [Cytophagales bacterium]|nr:30S ribosomal protein S10 [Cytophagales bacterium]